MKLYKAKLFLKLIIKRVLSEIHYVSYISSRKIIYSVALIIKNINTKFDSPRRRTRILVIYDYKDWVLGRWALNIIKYLTSSFDIVCMSMYSAEKNPKYAKKLISTVDVVHILLPQAYPYIKDMIKDKFLISTIHHWIKWDNNLTEIIERSNIVITCALEWKRRLEKNGVSQNKIRIVYSGVEDHFLNKELKIKRDNNKITIGFFAKNTSNECDRKGINHLLFLSEKIIELKCQIDFKFVITGSGWDDLVTNIRNHGIEVIYMPNVPIEDMPRLYRLIDFYLILSSVEGGPVTISEAMISGCCVLSTNVGVAGEFLKDGITGFLIDREKPAEILDLIYKIHNDHEMKKSISNNAKIFAESNLQFKQTFMPLLLVYDELSKIAPLGFELYYFTKFESWFSSIGSAKVLK